MQLFFRLASTLTRADTQLRRAVDYVCGFLLNDNFATIIGLKGYFVQETEHKNKNHVELEVARRYMKYGSLLCGCITHNILFGLSPNSGGITYEKPCCVGCTHLFYLIHHLRNAIEHSRNEDIEMQNSAIRALERCNTKMLLILRHCLRVMKKNKSQLKTSFLGWNIAVNRKKTYNECVIVIDYKMKFEPCYYREKTNYHYCKRGISWQSAMVSYYSLEEVNGIQAPVLHKINMDHIIKYENKQNVTTVLWFK